MEENKITPYDTGKVKIGLLYQPKAQNSNVLDGNIDADHLQHAYLQRSDTSWSERIKRIVTRVLGA